jgi:NAD(P)-dependent dehydrogenase (short-subunit alcohol dehydrogenase family)
VTGASSGLGVEFAQGLAMILGARANAVHKTIGYAATKGAVTNMTRQLAVEWAP